MGVMEWDQPAKTVIGSGDIHAGAAAVADPRMPEPNDRGVYVIIAEDGTWHRPVTTFEMAMLQGLPATFQMEHHWYCAARVIRDGESA